MRGNNLSYSAALFFRSGSPPLAREQPLYGIEKRCCQGITPACAGTTYRDIYAAAYRQDHPRLRGNNAAKMASDFDTAGSPPLAREQQRRRSAMTVFFRITPACAGTTMPSKLYTPHKQDHTRLRGNNHNRYR